MTTVEEFAPAKVNLTLHVTGQRGDGYHLLDSFVGFADIGDRLRVSRATKTVLRVTGPGAGAVPADAGNLCWQAAARFDVPVTIELEKTLPAAAGIGGGSADAAAVIRAMTRLTGRPAPFDPLELGADVPVCLASRAARVRGIGEQVDPWPIAPLPAVLVNPRAEMPTPAVFAALAARRNPAMTPRPEHGAAAADLRWLAAQRNDLQAPAVGLQPVIGDVLNALSALEDVRLVRMSGSGATCFALFDTVPLADARARQLAVAHPGWWIRACQLS